MPPGRQVLRTKEARQHWVFMSDYQLTCDKEELGHDVFSSASVGPQLAF